MGYYQFFEMDQIKISTAINYIHHNKKWKHVFCMLLGHMALNQKKLPKKHCIVDTNQYCALSKWFIEDSGQPGFQNFTIPEDCLIQLSLKI